MRMPAPTPFSDSACPKGPGRPALGFEASTMGQSPAPNEMPVSPKDHLSPEEVWAAVDSLSDDDKLRLGRIDKRHRGGTDFAEGGLVHDAICAAIEGTRKCPRDTVVIAFLAQTMRSFASHRRKELKKQVSLTIARDGGHDDGNQRDWPSGDPNPEEQLIDKDSVDVVAAIHNVFKDDEQAMLVLLGWADDMKGKDLREFANVDQAGLDYIIKRIRRVMSKRYPTGWIP